MCQHCRCTRTCPACCLHHCLAPSFAPPRPNPPLQLWDVVCPLPVGPWHDLPPASPHLGPYPASLHVCDKSGVVVVVLSDGACALLGMPPGGLSSPRELAFSHWVCAPSSGAVCAAVGASAQMVAVGCTNGTLELYRWGGRARTPAP